MLKWWLGFVKPSTHAVFGRSYNGTFLLTRFRRQNFNKEMYGEVKGQSGWKTWFYVLVTVRPCGGRFVVIDDCSRFQYFVLILFC